MRLQFISPITNLKYISGFSDKDQNINPEFYGSKNNLDFSEENGVTTVSISIKYTTIEILEMMIEKGFKKGFTMTLDNLHNLLENLTQKLICQKNITTAVKNWSEKK